MCCVAMRLSDLLQFSPPAEVFCSVRDSSLVEVEVYESCKSRRVLAWVSSESLCCWQPWKEMLAGSSKPQACRVSEAGSIQQRKNHYMLASVSPLGFITGQRQGQDTGLEELLALASTALFMFLLPDASELSCLPYPAT